MPVVPTTTQPQVGLRPLGAPRVDTRAPAEVFGGGEAADGIDLTGATRVLASVFEDERRKADQVAVLDADSRAWQLEKSLFHDPEKGAFSVRGRAAIDAGDQAMTSYTKGLSEIENSLTSDAQKAAFRARAQSRQVGLDGQVQNHVSGEIRRYDDSTYTAALANRVEQAALAFSDPAKLAELVSEQRAIVRDYAARTGMPPEVTAQQETAAVSKVHVAVVERMLANDQDLTASQYAKDHKTEIAGSDITTIEKALEEGSLRGAAQRKGDEIMATAKTRTDGLAAADAIDDPKLRDAVRQRVNQAFNERKAAEQETQNELYLQATNLVDARPNVPARQVIPSPLWAKLDLGQRNALESRSGESSNNDRAWLEFIALPAEQLGAMSRAEFETGWWAKFDKGHRTRAEAQWGAAIDAVKSGRFDTEHLSATLSFSQRVDNTLRSSGLIPAEKTPAKMSKDEAMLYARFETEAAARIENYELTKLGGKRKATGEEQQQIIDELTVKRVFVDKSWGTDKEQLTALLTADERGRAYVPYAKIPPAEREQISNVMKSRGFRVTNAKLQRAYAAFVIGDRALFDAIVKE